MINFLKNAVFACVIGWIVVKFIVLPTEENKTKNKNKKRWHILYYG